MRSVDNDPFLAWGVVDEDLRDKKFLRREWTVFFKVRVLDELVFLKG